MNGPSNGPFCPNRRFQLLPLLQSLYQCTVQENVPASPWQRALHCEWKQKSPKDIGCSPNIMYIRQATKEWSWVIRARFLPFKSNITSTETVNDMVF